jgi:hypothetical protein
MEQCNCKYTWEYQEFLNEQKNLSVQERLLNTIFRPFDGDQYEFVCEECRRIEEAASQEEDEMDAIVAASDLPEADFNWRDPVAGDFRSLYLAHTKLRMYFIANFTKTGEMVSIAHTSKIIAHWAGISDPEDLQRKLEIGMWVDEAFTVAVMDYDEMDDYYRRLNGEDVGEIVVDEDIANDAFNFIRNRMMEKVREDMILRELEKEFNDGQ